MPDFPNGKPPGVIPGPSPQAQLLKTPIPSTPGRLELRYTTSEGHFLGEVSIFAINAEVLKNILQDLQGMISPISVVRG